MMDNPNINNGSISMEENFPIFEDEDDTDQDRLLLMDYIPDHKYNAQRYIGEGGKLFYDSLLVLLEY